MIWFRSTVPVGTFSSSKWEMKGRWIGGLGEVRDQRTAALKDQRTRGLKGQKDKKNQEVLDDHEDYEDRQDQQEQS